MNWVGFRNLLSGCRDGAYFRRDNLRLALAQVYDLEKNTRYGYTDADHLNAAIGWLERAQDVTGDGGVAGRYSLSSGWTSSYPETTGYIIPTFLKLYQHSKDSRFHSRARQAIDFLLPLQLPGGGFPRGEFKENCTEPSPFNTAQIMHGLQAWAEHTGDPRCLQALQRAGDWLCDIQEPDGCWSRHFYLGVIATYSAHLACWRAEAGALLKNERFIEAAKRHLRWTLQQFDSASGWFDLCGFTTSDHDARQSVLHTIAYTIWGVLRTAEITGSREGQLAAEMAAGRVVRRLELSRRLPGILDHRWRGVANFTCLTGNCQMALIWLYLYRKHGDARMLSAAMKAFDLVKATQPMASDSGGIRGGIAGSHPVWGAYIPHAFPNWAVKYFIDCLLAKREALEHPRVFEARPLAQPPGVPTELLPRSEPRPQRSIKVALLTTPSSEKFSAFIESWSGWGFHPDLVIIERRSKPPFWKRVRGRIETGRIPVLSHAARHRSPHPNVTPPQPKIDVAGMCRSRGIELQEVDSVNSSETAQVVRDCAIDILVHAGVGLMRSSIIQAARLGILNAHMGLLPAYRGVNVAEWSIWNGDPAGCSVHFIDEGIDTGDILLTRVVNHSKVKSVAELRTVVDQAQIKLLGEVLQYILSTGCLPKPREQSNSEGLQYFTMHPSLVELLNDQLASAFLRTPS